MEVKGSALISTLDFIKLNYGDDAINKIRDKLPAEEQQVIDGAIIQPAWYPFSLYVNLTKYTDQIYGIGDLSVAKDMGRFAADHDLKTIYRIFYKLGSPQFIISQATKVLTTYFSQGEFKTISKSEGMIVLELHNFIDVDLVFTQRLSGFMEKTLELSGGKEPKVWANIKDVEGKKVATFNAFWK